MINKKNKISLLLAGFMLMMPLASVHAKGADSEFQTRTIKFPATSIGSIYLAPNEILSGRDVLRKSRRIRPAVGTVELKVRTNETVMVDLNPDVFAHPEILKEVSEHGIDRLRFAFYAMDDNSPLHCDDALKQLPHFKDLISVDVDRSDATDVGLSHVKGMTKLLSISAFASDVKGKSFKAFQSCPKLMDIETDHCAIDPQYFADLAGIKSLKSLKLRQTNLDDNSLPIVARCAALTYLDISTNAKITDKSIGSLKKLQHLDILELKDTKITMDGIKSLKGLPLTELVMPSQLSGKEDKLKARELFPKATITGSSKHVVTANERQMFAPLR